MEAKLGLVAGKASRYRQRILRSNGIASRHYAIGENGEQTHLNEELTANAVKNALASRGLTIADIDMLATGTTTPDVQMPGFSSMVHGRLGGHPMECLSAGGICASGAASLRAAVNAIRVGDHDVAVATGSELVSPMLRGSRFEEESVLAPERENAAGSYQYFNADFLRWMLSDGAGAVVLEPKPRPDGLSLRIEWIEMNSFANKYPACMYMGLSDPANPRVGTTISGYSTLAEAERDGLNLIRQDTKLLEVGITDIVGTEAVRLKAEGKLDSREGRLVPAAPLVVFLPRHALQGSRRARRGDPGREVVHEPEVPREHGLGELLHHDRGGALERSLQAGPDRARDDPGIGGASPSRTRSSRSSDPPA